MTWLQTAIKAWIVRQLLDRGRALDQHWFPLAHVSKSREGRMVRFNPSGNTMGYVDYTMRSVRGDFVIGWVRFRNQWGYYSVTFAPDVPVNKEIVTEIYAFLRELRS